MQGLGKIAGGSSEAEEEIGDRHESPLSGQLTSHSRFEAVISKIHIYGTVPVFDADK
jgi:hypothetical protein